MVKRLLLMISTITLLVGGGILANPVYAENTSVHVHVEGEAEIVSSIAVEWGSATLQLTETSEKLYSIEKPEEIVKPDISSIVVTKTDGTIETFSPAIDYAGVEGKGTINYWIELSGEDATETVESNEDKAANANNDNINANNTESETNNNTEETSQNETNSQAEKPENSTNESVEDEDTAPLATVDGGELPATSSPWFNLLIISGLLAVISGAVLFRLNKSAR